MRRPRQRAQYQRVDLAVKHTAYANAECERQHSDRGESGRARQHAQRVHEVPPEVEGIAVHGSPPPLIMSETSRRGKTDQPQNHDGEGCKRRWLEQRRNRITAAIQIGAGEKSPVGASSKREKVQSLTV